MMINEKLTQSIISAAYQVHNTLGEGFLEKCYREAMKIECKNLNIEAESEVPLKVYYQNILIGNFYADLIVENKVLLELKAVKEIIPAHTAQLLHYLKATRIRVGLIINFGSQKLQIKRMVN